MTPRITLTSNRRRLQSWVVDAAEYDGRSLMCFALFVNIAAPDVAVLSP